MKRKTITLIIIIGTLIISCNKTSHNPSIPAPIPSHVEKNVTISRGTNFETGKPVFLDPITGEKIEPCGDINIENNTEEYEIQMKKKELMDQANEAKQENQKCLTKVIDPKLRTIIDSTRRIIEGTIIKNGETIRSKAIVEVTILSEGSNCETVFSGGKQYELCTSLERSCFSYSKYPDPPRSFFSSKCSQFPFW